MKKLLCLLLLIGLFGCAGMDLTQTAYPVAPSPLKPYGSDAWTLPANRPNLNLSGSVAMGSPISEINVETPVTEIIHVRADGSRVVVGSITFECSVLTDEAEVCEWKFYVMNATPGVATVEMTLPATP